MAYGDVNYELVRSASIAYETTGLSQALLLDDNSLSSLFNLDDVLQIEAELLNANAFRLTTSALSNNSGITFDSGSPTRSLKPMKVRNINSLAVYHVATSSNASAAFHFWRRNP